ncbi:hypothetical protein SUGI_0803310 [Cryptomeria japonica]|nr:hypothetical protein SUGI_0803310 [Cryptomeria japonica]
MAENSLNFEKIEADYPLMEDFVDWKGRPAVKGKHGGVRATLFVYVAEALENMAFLGNGVNLVQYFLGVMHYDVKDSSTMLTNYMGTAFLLALFGAFISDSFITRFYTNIIFAFVEVIGYTLLTVQAHKPSLQPPFCDLKSNPAAICQAVEGKNSVVLYMGLYLVALGTGGLKATLPTMGAEQFDEMDPKESKLISSFFNWFFFSIIAGASIGVTFLVWVQTSTNPKLGWDWAFGVSSGVYILVIIVLLSGVTKYRNQVPRGSPLTSIVQVIVVANRKRNLPLPTDAAELYELNAKEADAKNELLQNTQQFRFLDKAAILGEGEMDGIEGTSLSPWQVCTVTQVEQVKILIRMVPIFCSTIMVMSEE